MRAPTRPRGDFMNRFRSLAAILLAFAPMIAMAQKKTSTKLAAGRPGATTKSAAAGDILPFKATETTLPNGLKVIVVPTGFPNIVSLQIPVQTGSRNEVEPGKSGFAHFFEHIMSRGTKTMTQEQANELITKAGARENAYTRSEEHTSELQSREN